MSAKMKALCPWIPEEGKLRAISRYESDLNTKWESWETHAKLGLLYWLFDRDRALVQRHFVRAVEEGLYYERVPPSDSRRLPFDFGTWLGIVLAFGSVEQRQRAGVIPRRHWYHPERPARAKEADAYGLVQAHLCSALTLELAQPYLEMAYRYNAGRDVVEFERPWVEGCLAITARDEATWNACIASMVKYHGFIARFGDLHSSNFGLMCLPALGLARLGMEAGMACTVEDLRLPVDLLEGATNA